MKKIPTLFERIYENHCVVGITENVTPGMEWVLAGDGDATVKIDGSCCAIINGKLYKRYDAKKGKKPPAGAIPCCDPDPVTGHWPHWVKCDADNPADKWFVRAWENTCVDFQDGTYEAIGQHFQGNPYKFDFDTLVRHGEHKVSYYDIMIESGALRHWADTNKKDKYEHIVFMAIREYLKTHNIEGFVFWKDGEPQCKIKRTDFGFDWPIK